MSTNVEKSEAALVVAEEILSGLALGSLKIGAASLRCLHLARLLGDIDSEEWLSWESFGYPRTSEGFIDSRAFKVACAHGREIKRAENGSQRIFVELAGELESSIDAHKQAIGVVTTSGVSVAGEWATSAMINITNSAKSNATTHIAKISEAERHITILQGQYYNYASAVSVELRFSGIVEEVFRSYRGDVDRCFLALAPESLKRLDSAYRRLASNDPESWSQAVSSCRRVFEELANAIYKGPADKYETKSGKILNVSGDHYKNRIFAIIDSVTESRSARQFVGANAMHIIDLVDGLHSLLNRGVHEVSEPLSYEEARAAVLHTYILLGDVALLAMKKDINPQE